MPTDLTPSQLAAALELLAKSEPSEWHPTQVYADQFNALARQLVPDLLAALDLARAALARIAAFGCERFTEPNSCNNSEMHPDDGPCLPCIAAACLASRAGDGEG